MEWYRGDRQARDGNRSQISFAFENISSPSNR